MTQPPSATVPHPVDIHVGRRLRERRLVRGYSQEQVAQGLGVSLAQYRRYENGTNRMAASRLHEVARIVGVQAQYFFDNMPAAVALRPPANARVRRPPLGGASGLVPAGEREQEERITAELVEAYHRIQPKSVRRKLLELMQRLGDMCAELDEMEQDEVVRNRSVEPTSAERC